jgi:hypothetical protein
LFGPKPNERQKKCNYEAAGAGNQKLLTKLIIRRRVERTGLDENVSRVAEQQEGTNKRADPKSDNGADDNDS